MCGAPSTFCRAWKATQNEPSGLASARITSCKTFRRSGLHTLFPGLETGWSRFSGCWLAGIKHPMTSCPGGRAEPLRSLLPCPGDTKAPSTPAGRKSSAAWLQGPSENGRDPRRRQRDRNRRAEKRCQGHATVVQKTTNCAPLGGNFLKRRKWWAPPRLPFLLEVLESNKKISSSTLAGFRLYSPARTRGSFKSLFTAKADEEGKSTVLTCLVLQGRGFWEEQLEGLILGLRLLLRL